MKLTVFLSSLLLLTSAAQAGYVQDVHCEDALQGAVYDIRFSEIYIPNAKASVTFTHDGKSQNWDLTARYYMSIDMDTLKEFQGFVVNFNPTDSYETVSMRTRFDEKKNTGSMTVKNEELTGRKGEVKVLCTRTEGSVAD